MKGRDRGRWPLLSWQFRLGLALLSLTVLLFAVDWLIYRNPDIFFYLMGDIAFIPFSVLVVTLILSGLLEQRARRERLQKMNMVIGTFFSEVGVALLRRAHSLHRERDGMERALAGLRTAPGFDFAAAAADLDPSHFRVQLSVADLPGLQAFVREKREFLLRLLENPNLLEHESFTELLRAVFHLVEELSYRDDLPATPESDLRHLAGDFDRVYGLMAREWLKYMAHLKADYPYLFSLALRLNPFDPEVGVVVRQ